MAVQSQINVGRVKERAELLLRVSDKQHLQQGEARKSARHRGGARAYLDAGPGAREEESAVQSRQRDLPSQPPRAGRDDPGLPLQNPRGQARQHPGLRGQSLRRAQAGADHRNREEALPRAQKGLTPILSIYQLRHSPERLQALVVHDHAVPHLHVLALSLEPQPQSERPVSCQLSLPPVFSLRVSLLHFRLFELLFGF